MEVLWAHTYSSYSGQMVSYCVREAGSGVLCLPQMEKEMVGVELASSCHTWLQEHETISPGKRRLERQARQGRGDGGEVELLPSVWKRKRKERGQASLDSKVSEPLLEHCQLRHSLVL